MQNKAQLRSALFTHEQTAHACATTTSHPQALERGPDASSSSEDEQEEQEAPTTSARKPKAYDMEQELLRRSFLDAAQVGLESRGMEYADSREQANKTFFCTIKVT